jgi:type II secretory pathway component PulM
MRNIREKGRDVINDMCAFTGAFLLAVSATGLIIYGMIEKHKEARQYMDLQRQAHAIADRNGNGVLETSELASMLGDMKLVDTSRVYTEDQLSGIKPSEENYRKYIGMLRW